MNILIVIESLVRTSNVGVTGLEFVLDGESVEVAEPILVDMTVAPVDSDVTCVLYVTAESRLDLIALYLFIF